jgi:predicted dehydrogenase
VAGIQLSSLRRRLPTWFERLPGGLLFDEMPHLIYLLQRFVGRPVDVDHVRGVPEASAGPRAVEALVRGPAAAGQITMVLEAPVSEWQVVVVTDGGVVALDLFRDIAVRVRPDGRHGPFDILRTSAKALADHASGFVASGARYVPGRLYWGHDTLMRAFADAILRAGPSPVTAEEALGVVAVGDRIVAGLGAGVER